MLAEIAAPDSVILDREVRTEPIVVRRVPARGGESSSSWPIAARRIFPARECLRSKAQIMRYGACRHPWSGDHERDQIDGSIA